MAKNQVGEDSYINTQQEQKKLDIINMVVNSINMLPPFLSPPDDKSLIDLLRIADVCYYTATDVKALTVLLQINSSLKIIDVQGLFDDAYNQIDFKSLYQKAYKENSNSKDLFDEAFAKIKDYYSKILTKYDFFTYKTKYDDNYLSQGGNSKVVVIKQKHIDELRNQYSKNQCIMNIENYIITDPSTFINMQKAEAENKYGKYLQRINDLPNYNHIPLALIKISLRGIAKKKKDEEGERAQLFDKLNEIMFTKEAEAKFNKDPKIFTQLAYQIYEYKPEDNNTQELEDRIEALGLAESEAEHII